MLQVTTYLKNKIFIFKILLLTINLIKKVADEDKNGLLS